MAKMNPVATGESLVQYVAFLAGKRDVKLSKLRLVKLLYLADLAHARTHGGQTLTGWPWTFLHYGPFCTESARAIELAVDGGLIAARPYQSPYDDDERFLYEYEGEEEPDVAKRMPIEVAGFLQAMIRRFGDDTPALLDFVYFDTEPMLDAEPGARLDFTLARRPERPPPVEMKKLSARAVRRGKELLDKLARQNAARMHGKEPGQDWYDQAYSEAMSAMDGPGVEAFEGGARLRDVELGKGGCR